VIVTVGADVYPDPPSDKIILDTPVLMLTVKLSVFTADSECFLISEEKVYPVKSRGLFISSFNVKSDSNVVP